MAMNVEMFMDDEHAARVESVIHASDERTFAVLRHGTTDVKVVTFLYDLNTIERMQLELASLARELRDVHGWTSDSDYPGNYYSAADVPGVDDEPSNIGEDYSV